MIAGMIPQAKTKKFHGMIKRRKQATKGNCKMAKIRDENDAYQASARQFQRAREELNRNKQVWIIRVRQCNQRWKDKRRRKSAPAAIKTCAFRPLVSDHHVLTASKVRCEEIWAATSAGAIENLR